MILEVDVVWMCDVCSGQGWMMPTSVGSVIFLYCYDVVFALCVKVSMLSVLSCDVRMVCVVRRVGRL